MKLLSVAGARPNFMKIAPLLRTIKERQNGGSQSEPIEHLLVHTGQHYDQRMSQLFFDDLQIPRPDIDLGIGSGSHAEQVGKTMIAFEQVLREEQPDWVIVVGDVNATCACSITAKKEHVKLAHVEAGLRSHDLEMPEEINRIVTDRLADLLFTTDELASQNLLAEGTDPARIKLVGNIMIDSLESHRPTAASLDLNGTIGANLLVPKADLPTFVDNRFTLVTMHRPSNVDRLTSLAPIINFLIEEATALGPVVWTIHPRTQKALARYKLWEQVIATPNLFLLQPLGYHEMLRLNLGARIMLTDSGGLQEECSVIGTPCITMRFNTERPITLEENGGPCILTGNEVDKISAAFHRKIKETKIPHRPPLWDGKTAQRIVAELVR